RDASVYPRLNSKAYVTAYPPLSQALFRVPYTLAGENVTAMKAIFAAFEFMALLLACRMLRAFGAPLEPLYLVAWNPFFIFEFSHSGHSDGAMMFFTLLAIYLLHRARRTSAMTSYGLAVLSKLHPALWFPLFWRRAGARAALAAFAVGGAFTALY